MVRVRRWWVPVAVVAALLLGGCSGASESADEGGGSAPAPDVPEEPTDDGDRGEADDGQDTFDGREVVRKAQLDLVVEDTDEAVLKIRSILAREGGFVEASDLRRGEQGEQLQGWLTLRVPADRLDVVLDDLEDVAAEVRARTSSSEDVTGQALDLDARLTNLRAFERELRELLAEVRDRPGAGPEELLAVFDRISQTRSDIERLEAQRDALGELVDLATVTVVLTPSEAAASLTSPWSPVEVVRRATRALITGAQAVASGLIWVGVIGLPVVLVVGLLALPARRLVRRWRRGAT